MLFDILSEFTGKNDFAIIPVEDGKSLLMYLKPYTPYKEEGFIVDAYYSTSNISYHENIILAGRLSDGGFAAARKHNYLLKPIAAKAGLVNGGFINTLTYNIAYGSFFHIESLLIEGNYSYSPRLNNPGCAGCGECIRACPNNALSTDGYKRERCLRQLMIAGEVRDDAAAESFGGRLFGCDICQRVCPANKFNTVSCPKEINFAAEQLLIENLLPMKEIVGANYVRKNFVNLAILAAGNLRLSGHCESIEKLSLNPDYSVNAARALKQLFRAGK